MLSMDCPFGRARGPSCKPKAIWLIVMLNNEGGFISRRPRHQAAGSPAVRVRVERADGEEPVSIEAELLDLSRSGVRLRVAADLKIQEPITVQLYDESSGLRLTRRAKVRWRRPEQGEITSVGCLFEEQVEWEMLGELFLNEVLSTARPSPPASPSSSDSG